MCVVRPSNSYGPQQYPEKFIPLMIANINKGRKVPLYGEGLDVCDRLHVDDCCLGLFAALEQGKQGEGYNIGGRNDLRSIEIARRILGIMGEGDDAIEFVPDRPGNDFRYASDSSKTSTELGRHPHVKLDDGLAAAVRWFKERPEWWQPLKERLSRESRGFWTAAPVSSVGE